MFASIREYNGAVFILFSLENNARRGDRKNVSFFVFLVEFVKSHLILYAGNGGALEHFQDAKLNN